MRSVYKKGDISYNEDNGIIFIGINMIELKMIGSITAEVDSGKIYKVTIRLKSNGYDVFIMNEEALELIKELKAEFEKKSIWRKNNITISNIKNRDGKRNLGIISTFINSIFHIGLHWWILYIILIIGFTSKSYGSELSDVQNQNFPFTYIYDVNLDKCVTTDSYKGKFSFNDLKNPKAVLEFPQRPGELTLVLPNGDMYVFTLDKLGCQNYRAHFFEDMSRQNKMEDDRYKDIDIDRN